MKRWSFLSLSPLPWLLSMGIHVIFILAILWTVRTHPFDLTSVSLDLAPVASQNSSKPIEDVWQKPMLRMVQRRIMPKRIATPQPVVSQAQSVGGEGNSYIRSIAQVSQLPSFKNQVKPVYPLAAKRAGIEGVVILQVDIDAKGSVMDVQVVHGIGYGCDEAASIAMQESTFIPAYAGNEPVPVRVRIPYRFQIND